MGGGPTSKIIRASWLAFSDLFGTLVLPDQRRFRPIVTGVTGSGDDLTGRFPGVEGSISSFAEFVCVMTKTVSMSETGQHSAAQPLPNGPLSDAPSLSSRGLTILLVLMCLVPVVVITILQFAMPPVKPDFLRADIELRNVPPSSYYQLSLDERRDFPDAEVLITNTMDVPWTNLNVRINNGNYQIYDHDEPVLPGQQRGFLLNRFVHRTGAIYQVGLVRPSDLEIYAALPDRSRATLEYTFPD